MWRFIDHCGDVRDLGQLEQHYPLSGFTDRQTAIDWAIRNIGLVLINTADRGVRVRLRPEKTSSGALSETLYLLAEARIRRSAVSCFGTQWEHRLFATTQCAAEFLATLSIAISTEKQNDFQRREIDPDLLTQGCDLHILLERWRNFNTNITLQELVNELPPLLRDRAIILEASGRNSRLVIRHVGRGFRIFDPRWVARAPGQDIEDQPDFRYGLWAALSYRKSLQSGLPTIDDVDAIVDNPYTQTRNRGRYRRLIVPIARPDGSKLLLGCSTLDSTIDLRREAGRKRL
jgi:hypothetical protein